MEVYYTLQANIVSITTVLFQLCDVTLHHRHAGNAKSTLDGAPIKFSPFLPKWTAIISMHVYLMILSNPMINL